MTGNATCAYYWNFPYSDTPLHSTSSWLPMKKKTYVVSTENMAKTIQAYSAQQAKAYVHKTENIPMDVLNVVEVTNESV